MTLVLALACAALAAKVYYRPAISDPRLLGTWVSDAERTFDLLGYEPTDEQRIALENVFGKMKITYTENSYTTELDGDIDTMPYTVIGIDKHSVVIRDSLPPPPEVETVFVTSTFSKIYFDGDDGYWLNTEIGNFTEYFKRVAE